MTERFNEKVARAIEKLKNLKDIKVKSIGSSNYSFGIEIPCIKDRFNIEITLDSNSTCHCQILFDARDLSFCPDIILDKLPVDFNTDKNALLPNEDWNLDQEDCLYVWFKRILNLIKKPEPKKQWSLFDQDSNSSKSTRKFGDSRKQKAPLYTTNMDDDFEDDLELFLSKDVPDENIVEVQAFDKSEIDNDFFADQDETLGYKAKTEPNVKKEKVPAYDKERYRLNRNDTMGSDFFADQDETLGYKPKSESSDKKEKTPAYDKERYRLKRNDTMGSDFFADQDETLGYKVKGEPSEKKETVLTYDKNRNKFKRKETIDNDFFADQDETLAYKTKEETRKKPRSDFFSASRVPTTTRIEIFNTLRRETTNIDDDDDDTILVLPSKTLDVGKRRDDVLYLPKAKKPDLGRPSIVDQRKLFDLQVKSDKHYKFRKKFLTAWLTRYENNIMKYDAEFYSNFTLFMDFRLSNKSYDYAKFKEHKEQSLQKYCRDHPEVDQVSKPKSIAPVIVHFRLQRISFPSNDLEIKLISATNTNAPRSSDPDTLDLKYAVDEHKDLSQTIDEIMDRIQEIIPAFHYQLDD